VSKRPGIHHVKAAAALAERLMGVSEKADVCAAGVGGGLHHGIACLDPVVVTVGAEDHLFLYGDRQDRGKAGAEGEITVTQHAVHIKMGKFRSEPFKVIVAITEMNDSPGVRMRANDVVQCTPTSMGVGNHKDFHICNTSSFRSYYVIDRRIMEYKVVTDMNEKDRDQLEAAARSNPAVAQALSKLSKEDMAKLRAVLADPEQTRRILSTPMAQQMLRRMSGEDKK